MELDTLVERNEDVDEDKNQLNVNFYTDARTPEIADALRFVTAACVQSGIRFVKIEHDIRQEDGENCSKEFIVLDAEEADHQVTQSLTQELIEFLDYDYELGADGRNPNILYVVAELPEELLDEDELERLEGDSNE